MMRLNVKVALILCMTISIVLIVTLWANTNCNNFYNNHKFNLNRKHGLLETKDDDASVALMINSYPPNDDDNNNDDDARHQEIDCDINGEYVISCRKQGSEVYVPFSFLHKYFEVYGKLVRYEADGTGAGVNARGGALERFEWSHSYSKVYRPSKGAGGGYDPHGVYMYFENYNVEVRERVKCVSGAAGVPVSTQWQSQGYYYVTQIAQFGLAHYSKNLTEPEPRRTLIEDGRTAKGAWRRHSSLGDLIDTDAPSNDVVLERRFDSSVDSWVLTFTAAASRIGGGDEVRLKLDHVLDLVMAVDVVLEMNGSLTVVLENRETHAVYKLHYIHSDLLITAQGVNIYYGIGTSGAWKRLTRDLCVDLQKGLNYLDKDNKSKHKIPRSKLKITSIVLKGSGAIDNLTLSTSEHMRQFYDAAEWFVQNQNAETGGWQIPVRRKLASGFHDLDAGWYSAMGQGHAISVLSRAYYHSGGDARYLNAATAALQPFHQPSTKPGGVAAKFLDKYTWYEEYPTQPSSFVLNGFIYALLGLYDLMSVTELEDQKHQTSSHQIEAERLYTDGLASLRALLPLYDLASGTAYDLRHITLGCAPNVARWDYHATHVNQLLLLSTIVAGRSGGVDDEAFFAQTAERWIGYMMGKRAPHN